MLIQYQTSTETPHWCKLTYGNSSVAVGEAPGEGDGMDLEFEIIDCYDGKQLAFRRRKDAEDMLVFWEGIMTKAHHELLSLHYKAQIQAELSNELHKLNNRAHELLEHISRTMMTDVTAQTLTEADVRNMSHVVNNLQSAYDKLDRIVDPD
jgi:hypothetical protein